MRTMIVAGACGLVVVSLAVALEGQEQHTSVGSPSPVLHISVAEKEQVGHAHVLTLPITRPPGLRTALTNIYALVIYLPNGKPGEPTALAASAAVEGDLGVGMASGDGMGFDGEAFFSYGANIKKAPATKDGGAFLWIKLPSTPAYDLTKQPQIRIPVGEWLVNGVSLRSSGRCAIALGTLEFGGPKEMPRFHAISNTVEVDMNF